MRLLALGLLSAVARRDFCTQGRLAQDRKVSGPFARSGRITSINWNDKASAKVVRKSCGGLHHARLRNTIAGMFHTATDCSRQFKAPTTDAAHAKVRIAAVSYLNTCPLIAGLHKLANVSITLAPPAQLLDMLLSGDVDVALAPIIDAARSPQEIVLLPVGGVGSAATTLTVRLFSSVPLSAITKVHADVESHTSIVLLRIVLNELHSVAPAIVPLDVRAVEAWPETALLIGDKVIASAPPPSTHPFTLDLGEAWRRCANLPFVYAVWMCVASSLHSPSVRIAATALDRQRRHNATRTCWIAATEAPGHGWAPAAARAYLQDNLQFTIGAEERKAAALFLDKACAMNLAPAGSLPLRWAQSVDWRAPVTSCPQ